MAQRAHILEHNVVCHLVLENVWPSYLLKISLMVAPIVLFRYSEFHPEPLLAPLAADPAEEGVLDTWRR